MRSDFPLNNNDESNQQATKEGRSGWSVSVSVRSGWMCDYFPTVDTFRFNSTTSND